MLGYQCCFCGETIAESYCDPCAVTVTLGANGPPDGELTQSLYCHVACLRRSVHESVTIYELPFE
jgi:hypothetical protein